MGILAPIKQKTQLAIEALNNNTALGTHNIPVELLKHGGEEVMNKFHKLVGVI
jgi:hypothetical protein